jgi:predicted aspartyl protease
LDTGATLTTITPQVAAVLGYTTSEGLRATTVQSATGLERSYLAPLEQVRGLGWVCLNIEANVAALPYGVDGLLGMDFLCNFNFEIRPAERRIIARPIVL